MNDILRIQNRDFCFLGQESFFKGHFDFKGPTILAGKMEGLIKTYNEAPFTIEKEGELRGNFTGHCLDIYGRFIGEIESSETVTIHTSAHVEGKIKAKNLVIHPGAFTQVDAQTLQNEN